MSKSLRREKYKREVLMSFARVLGKKENDLGYRPQELVSLASLRHLDQDLPDLAVFAWKGLGD